MTSARVGIPKAEILGWFNCIAIHLRRTAIPPTLALVRGFGVWYASQLRALGLNKQQAVHDFKQCWALDGETRNAPVDDDDDDDVPAPESGDTKETASEIGAPKFAIVDKKPDGEGDDGGGNKVH